MAGLSVARHGAETDRINEFLLSTVANLTSGDDLPHALECIVGGFARAIGAVHAMLFRHDPVTRKIRLHLTWIDGRVRYGVSGEEMPLLAAPFPDDITPAWRLMCERRGVFTTKLVPIPAEEFAWPGSFEYAARFGLSDLGHTILFVRDLPVGSISWGLSGGRTVSEADQPFIQAVAGQAAIAIRMIDLAREASEKATAQAQQRAATDRAEELSRANQVIGEVNRKLIGESSYRNALRHTLREMSLAVGVSMAHVYRYSPENDSFDHETAFAGEIVEQLEGHPHGGPGQSLPAFAVHTWEYKADDAASNCPIQSWHKDRKHSLVLMNVLKAAGRPIGLLEVAFSERVALSNGQAELLNRLCQQLTLAFQFVSLSEKAEDEVRHAAALQERNRIAREIHDTLAQGFAAIRMQLKAAQREPGFSQIPDPIQDYVARAQELASANLAEARQSIQNLRPHALEGKSLRCAVVDWVSRVQPSSSCPVRVNLPADWPVLPKNVEIELMRIVQESVTNSIKHAGATLIEVSGAAPGDGAIQLRVRDDGRGFSQEDAPLGFGLMGMHERARLIGATLTVVGEPGLGTEIVTAWSPDGGGSR